MPSTILGQENEKSQKKLKHERNKTIDVVENRLPNILQNENIRLEHLMDGEPNIYQNIKTLQTLDQRSLSVDKRHN